MNRHSILITAFIIINLSACANNAAPVTPTLPPSATSVINGPSAPPAATTAVIAIITTPIYATPLPYSSSTPVPTNTPLPTEAACKDDSAFVADVTIPDGTIVPMGTEFLKTWEIRNNGTCAWNGDYRLVMTYNTDGILAASQSIPMPPVLPGEGLEIGVTLRLSKNLILGEEQRAEFRIMNPAGKLFGAVPYVIVKAGPAGSAVGSPIPGKAAISGVLWLDKCVSDPSSGTDTPTPGRCIMAGDGSQHGDGIRQPDEKGVAAVLVELHAETCDGSLVLQGPTGSDGVYAFPQIDPGMYCVFINLNNPSVAQILEKGGFTFPLDHNNFQIIKVESGEIKTPVDFGWEHVP